MDLDKTLEEHAAPSPPPVQKQPDIKFSDAALAKRILIVEDNHINQVLLQKMLKALGFTIIDVAWNGKEGVDMVKAGPLAYNLILMDTSMPIMGGIEAAGLIHEMGLDIPIMAMIAHAMKEDRESFLKRGFDGYLSKPVRKPELRDTLVKWLDQ
ncbi:hypothetical protein V498_03652 [Pseudogymnoascus sp. VKM F-4517 (FW-2822)]|nr:hypothetical protein V498_03652 [Pseudogymnoascus sp. VKM F-4517 (FW-2822)]